MGSWVFLLVIAIAVMKYAAKAGAKGKTNDNAQTPSAPVQTVAAQKRARMARAEQWREAKARQDDARQLHSINMDSCESRLESLKTLYNAGILDREEYAQRVARVKAKHARGAGY